MTRIAGWTGGRSNLRILSNLADRRLARARCTWPLAAIGGEAVRDACAPAPDRVRQVAPRTGDCPSAGALGDR